MFTIAGPARGGGDGSPLRRAVRPLRRSPRALRSRGRCATRRRGRHSDLAAEPNRWAGPL